MELPIAWARVNLAFDRGLLDKGPLAELVSIFIFERRRAQTVFTTKVIVEALNKSEELKKTWESLISAYYPEKKYDLKTFVQRAEMILKQVEGKVFHAVVDEKVADGLRQNRTPLKRRRRRGNLPGESGHRGRQHVALPAPKSVGYDHGQGDHAAHDSENVISSGDVPAGSAPGREAPGIAAQHDPADRHLRGTKKRPSPQ